MQDVFLLDFKVLLVLLVKLSFSNLIFRTAVFLLVQRGNKTNDFQSLFKAPLIFVRFHSALGEKGWHPCSFSCET